GIARRRRGRPRDPPRDGEAARGAIRGLGGDGGSVRRGARAAGAERCRGAGGRAHAHRGAAVPPPAPRSGDRLPRLQPRRGDVGAGGVLAPVDDLLRLEEGLSRRVTEVLAPRLTTRPPSRDGGTSRDVPRDVPRSAKAYEFFLRGNELARLHTQAPLAREMYL